MQNKYWDSYPQEKGFNKENALRIQGHWVDLLDHNEILGEWKAIGKCNNTKEN